MTATTTIINGTPHRVQSYTAAGVTHLLCDDLTAAKFLAEACDVPGYEVRRYGTTVTVEKVTVH